MQVDIDKQLRRAFELFDSDKSGAIDQRELRVLFDFLGLALSDDEVREAMKSLDQDLSGGIQVDEFRDIITYVAPIVATKKAVERYRLISGSIIATDQARLIAKKSASFRAT